MSPDWKQMYNLRGGKFLSSVETPVDDWLHNFIPPDQQPKVLEVINRGISTKSKFEMEHKVFRADGTIGWNLSKAIPILDNRGEIVEWYGIASDFTERRRAEEALRESEQRWVITLASIGDAVIATDPGENITFMNREAEKLTGWNYREAVGIPLKQVINLVHKQLPISSEIQINRENVFNVLNHVVLINRSGEEIPVEKKLTSIKNNEGQEKGSVLVMHDITERIKTEQLIKKYNEDLEEKVKERTSQLEEAMIRAESADKFKTSFLLNMSHELRTPLHSIIGFSGILMKRLAGPLTDEQEKQLVMVQSSGRHLLSLINDILDISRIDAGELKLEFEKFDLQEIIEEVRNSLHPLAEKKGLDEDIEKLFNPFIQLENNLICNFEGSGLGLSITRKILDMLNGSITVRSEYGVGSSFTVMLPV